MFDDIKRGRFPMLSISRMKRPVPVLRQTTTLFFVVFAAVAQVQCVSALSNWDDFGREAGDASVDAAPIVRDAGEAGDGQTTDQPDLSDDASDVSTQDSRSEDATDEFPDVQIVQETVVDAGPEAMAEEAGPTTFPNCGESFGGIGSCTEPCALASGSFIGHNFPEKPRIRYCVKYNRLDTNVIQVMASRVWVDGGYKEQVYLDYTSFQAKENACLSPCVSADRSLPRYTDYTATWPNGMIGKSGDSFTVQVSIKNDSGPHTASGWVSLK